MKAIIDCFDFSDYTGCICSICSVSPECPCEYIKTEKRCLYNHKDILLCERN